MPRKVFDGVDYDDGYDDDYDYDDLDDADYYGDVAFVIKKFYGIIGLILVKHNPRSQLKKLLSGELGVALSVHTIMMRA
ncbi:hypothetical protein CRG98_027780 [Punica granatum]|uniref:Uncharacterized protein n=1 Tax=Punica granatum TaxID=22663 RepID=A0A2I0J6L3_PUNGR|nr:hypothetical protein CRG98_027780 [Punica granatum]